MPGARVILDTNIWSAIGDEGVARDFDTLMRQRGYEVLVPPSTLLEVVRLRVPEARQRIVEALARGYRSRLRSEAESEAGEIVRAIRELRPGWIRSRPDTARVASLNSYWTKGVWREALDDSTEMHRYLRTVGAVKPAHLLAVQREQRANFLRDKTRVRPLTEVVVAATPDDAERSLPGWSGDPTELWRIEARHVFWHELVDVAGRAVVTKEDTTYADWIGAHVDLAKLRRAPEDFTAFWLRDVEPAAVPRQWLRWAVRIVQADHKVTDGNPLDEQHSSYLVDCDLVLSADRRYVSVLEAVRADAPFAIAEPRLVSGDRRVPVMDRLADAL
ncbi:hypothetical protein V5P93_004845 [Actinokineospora auranticolor]|uniref:PIN domain-containing protein n=1 Tax=Actinokineospora auranticolor TaxID=155976 RepID=A0A2S6GNL9_9PSEU|nr:hypothetical protein [Actinokineospora auranticolor]PPK66807.1 hypothetical protein CLV40_109192 [Actinokineospora auranticolor]